MKIGAEIAQAGREYIDFGIVLLVFGFGLITFAILLFQLFCIGVAPFAGMMCALAAHRMGLSVWRYAIRGALYSLLLFLPWIYLMRQMRNGENSPRKLAFNYNALYIMWLFWILANTAVVIFYMFWLADITLPPEEWSWAYLLREYLFWLINGSIPIIGIFVLIESRKSVSRRHTAESRGTYDVPAGELLKFPYIMPFACFSANIIATPVAFLISVYGTMLLLHR